MSNSENIDVEKAKGNIYWDCYPGYCLPGMEDNRKYTSSEIEKEFLRIITSSWKDRIREIEKQDIRTDIRPLMEY